MLMNSTTGIPDSVTKLSGSGTFIGIADRQADNTLGATNDIRCRFRVRGVVTLTIAGLTGNELIGAAVYASDDGTFKLTSTTATQIGKIKEMVGVSTNRAKVAFEAVAARSI